MEIYNASSSPINLSGNYFSYFSSTREKWNEPYRNKEFPDFTLPPNSFFLIGLIGYPERRGNPSSDWQIYSSKQIYQTDGSVAIFREDPKNASTSKQAFALKIDAASWGAVSLGEGEPSSAPPKEFSLTRKKEQGRFVDSNDNRSDFTTSSPTPVNSSGEKGDILPPSAPIIANTSSSFNKIEIKWATSSDPDTPAEDIYYFADYRGEGKISTSSATTTNTEFLFKNLYYDAKYDLSVKSCDPFRCSGAATASVAISPTIPDWQMYGGNKNRNFLAGTPPPASSTPFWDYENNHGRTSGGATLDENGTLYVPSTQGILAIDTKNQKENWFFRTNSPVVSLSIGQDGSVYGITKSDKIIALSPSGKTKWEKPFNSLFYTSGRGDFKQLKILIEGNSLFYLVPAEENVKLISLDGKKGIENWSFLLEKQSIFSPPPVSASSTASTTSATTSTSTSTSTPSSATFSNSSLENYKDPLPSLPAIAGENVLLGYGNKLLAVNKESGVKSWEHDFAVEENCQGEKYKGVRGITSRENTAYLFVRGGYYIKSKDECKTRFLSFNLEDKKENWSKTAKTIYEKALSSQNGSIFFVSARGDNFYSYSPGGEELFSERQVSYEPFAAFSGGETAGGFGLGSVSLRLISENGKNLWEFRPKSNSNRVIFPFAISKKGTMFVPTHNRIYTFK